MLKAKRITLARSFHALVIKVEPKRIKSGRQFAPMQNSPPESKIATVSDFIVTLAAIAAPLLLAGIVVVTAAASILQFVFLHKIKSDVKAYRCLRCRAQLTEQSIDATDVLWRKHMENLLNQNPGTYFRVVRSVYAVCEACGAEYNYNEQTRRFSLNKDRLFGLDSSGN